MLFSALWEAMEESKTVQKKEKETPPPPILTSAPKCGQDLKPRVSEEGESAVCCN